MLRYYIVLILLLTVFSCTNKKQSFKLPDDKEVQDVVITVLKTEHIKNGRCVLYNKLICYDWDKEYPVKCWEKDSFAKESINDAIIREPVQNPLNIPNYLSVSYLKFIVEKNTGVQLTSNDTLYFRAQIDSCISTIIDTSIIDSIKMADKTVVLELLKELRFITVLSKPIFNIEKNIAFLRISTRLKETGGGKWILLQKKDHIWIRIKDGDYWNAD